MLLCVRQKQYLGVAAVGTDIDDTIEFVTLAVVGGGRSRGRAGREGLYVEVLSRRCERMAAVEGR